jgi:hypothetical protein
MQLAPAQSDFVYMAKLRAVAERDKEILERRAE